MCTYCEQFKKKATNLSERKGIKNTAQQLKIPYSTLAAWRSKQKQSEDQVCICKRCKCSTTGKNKQNGELKCQNTELLRINKILKKVVVLLAKDI